MNPAATKTKSYTLQEKGKQPTDHNIGCSIILHIHVGKDAVQHVQLWRSEQQKIDKIKAHKVKRTCFPNHNQLRKTNLTAIMFCNCNTMYSILLQEGPFRDVEIKQLTFPIMRVYPTSSYCPTTCSCHLFPRHSCSHLSPPFIYWFDKLVTIINLQVRQPLPN